MTYSFFVQSRIFEELSIESNWPSVTRYLKCKVHKSFLFFPNYINLSLSFFSLSLCIYIVIYNILQAITLLVVILIEYWWYYSLAIINIYQLTVLWYPQTVSQVHSFLAHIATFFSHFQSHHLIGNEHVGFSDGTHYCTLSKLPISIAALIINNIKLLVKINFNSVVSSYCLVNDMMIVH